MPEVKKVITHKVKRLDENGKPIKNDKNRFVYDVVNKEYRIDADFKPTAVEDIILEFIENYCVANGEEKWLVAQLEAKENTNRKQKDGSTKIVEKDKSFVSIRSDFVNKFFPEIIKGDKEKKPTKRAEMLARLTAKK